MGLDFICNQEIIQMARRNLTDNVWHYLTGGAESEKFRFEERQVLRE